MKFKAFLTQDGVNLLDKRFLPSLDKIGRVCHLYLTRDHAVFLHNLLGGDGVQSVAQFKKEVIFRDYRISSQNEDRIAFAIDVALLHRALRSAQAIQLQSQDETAAIQIKLVKKLPAGSRNPAPFLTFETKGLRSAVVQDVPISKPFSRSDVAQLQTALDASQDLPQVAFLCFLGSVHSPDQSKLKFILRTHFFMQARTKYQKLFIGIILVSYKILAAAHLNCQRLFFSNTRNLALLFRET